MGVTTSVFSAKRCAVQVMVLRSGNPKFEERSNILVSGDALCNRPCTSTMQNASYSFCQDAWDWMYKEVSKVYELQLSESGDG